MDVASWCYKWTGLDGMDGIGSLGGINWELNYAKFTPQKLKAVPKY